MWSTSHRYRSFDEISSTTHVDVYFHTKGSWFVYAIICYARVCYNSVWNLVYFLSPLELIIDMLSFRLFLKINKRSRLFFAVGNFNRLWFFLKPGKCFTDFTGFIFTDLIWFYIALIETMMNRQLLGQLKISIVHVETDARGSFIIVNLNSYRWLEWYPLRQRSNCATAWLIIEHPPQRDSRNYNHSLFLIKTF